MTRSTFPAGDRADPGSVVRGVAYPATVASFRRSPTLRVSGETSAVICHLMATQRLLDGRCECGAVRYVVDDSFLYAMNCHCTRCRAGTGSAFKAFAGIEREKLTVTSGADALLVYGDARNNHTRCGVCGSLLFSLVDGARVHVALGSLADEPSVRPSMHIFVGSKAAWFDITDDLPQFQELPDEPAPAV